MSEFAYGFMSVLRDLRDAFTPTSSRGAGEACAYILLGLTVFALVGVVAVAVTR